MKVVQKNCSKKQSKTKQRKSMAEIGGYAYISATPKNVIKVMQSMGSKY